MKIRNIAGIGKHLHGVIIEVGEEKEVDITPKEFKRLELDKKGLEMVKEPKEKKTIEKNKGD